MNSRTKTPVRESKETIQNRQERSFTRKPQEEREKSNMSKKISILNGMLNNIDKELKHLTQKNLKMHLAVEESTESNLSSLRQSFAASSMVSRNSRSKSPLEKGKEGTSFFERENQFFTSESQEVPQTIGYSARRKRLVDNGVADEPGNGQRNPGKVRKNGSFGRNQDEETSKGSPKKMGFGAEEENPISNENGMTPPRKRMKIKTSILDSVTGPELSSSIIVEKTIGKNGNLLFDEPSGFDGDLTLGQQLTGTHSILLSTEEWNPAKSMSFRNEDSPVINEPVSLLARFDKYAGENIGFKGKEEEADQLKRRTSEIKEEEKENPEVKGLKCPLEKEEEPELSNRNKMEMTKSEKILDFQVSDKLEGDMGSFENSWGMSKASSRRENSFGATSPSFESKLVVECLSPSPLHNGRVTSLHLVPDSDLFLSTSWDYKAKLWDASMDFAQAASTRFVKNGSIDLASGGFDHSKVRLKGEFQHKNRVQKAVSIGRDYFATSCMDKSIKLWSSLYPEGSYSLLGWHGGAVNDICLGPANILFSCGADSMIKTWDIERKAEVSGIKLPHPAGIIDFNSDADLVLASSNGSAGLWDSKTAVQHIKLVSHLKFTQVFFTASPFHVMAQEGLQLVSLWDLRKPEKSLKAIQMEQNIVNGCQLNDKMGMILFGDNIVKVASLFLILNHSKILVLKDSSDRGIQRNHWRLFLKVSFD